MSTWYVGGVDVSAFGAKVVGEQGILEMVGVDRDEIALMQRDGLLYNVKRRRYPQCRLSLVVIGTSESDVLTKLSSLKLLFSPGKGFTPLTRTDLPNRRLMIRATESSVSRTPGGLNVVQVEVTCDRFPFWEDDPARPGDTDNLLAYSETFNDGSYWGYGDVAYGADQVVGPDGVTLADTFVYTGANAQVYQVFSTVDGRNYTCSIWLRGTGTVYLSFQEAGDGDGTIYATSTVTLSSVWVRYSITGTKGSDGHPGRFIITLASGATMHLTMAMANVGSTVLPYHKTGALYCVNLLGTEESTMETHATVAWAAWGTGTLGTTATCYEGSLALTAASTAASGGCGTSRFIPVVPGQYLNASAYVRWASVPTDPYIWIYIAWYDSTKTYYSGSQATGCTGTTAYQRLAMANSVLVPPGVAFGRVAIVQTYNGSATFYVDAVQLEAGLYTTPWVSGQTAPTLYNPGNVNVYPDIYVTFYGATEGGWDFTLNGIRLDWDETGIAAGDVYRIDCLNGRIYKNGALHMHHLNMTNSTTGAFPHLVPGANTIYETAYEHAHFSAMLRGQYE